MDIQPTAFDLIVLGTGLEESLIAAAAATSGLSVLHLDNEAEYGSDWAALDPASFLEKLRRPNKSDSLSQADKKLQEDAKRAAGDLKELDIEYCGSSIYSNVEINEQPENTEELRQLSIDLAPKLLYTTGLMVEALLRFKAENYLVFRLVKSYFWQEGQMLQVPASRADIFQNADLSPVTKRSLMRFLKNTLDAIEGRGALKDAFGTGPFTRVLQKESLPPSLQSVILYCLAMIDHRQRLEGSDAEGIPEREPQAGAGESSDFDGGQIAAQEGLDRMMRFVQSANGHGSAFMAADYGAGELPQAFCRAAAVAGATYVLRAGVQALLLDQQSQKCHGVKLKNGQVLRCQALAANADFLPPDLKPPPDQSPGVNRAVAVLPGSLNPLCSGNPPDQFLLTLPPGVLSEGVPENPIRVLQLGSRSLVTSEDRKLLYLSTVSNGRPASEQLAPILETILQGRNQPPLLTAYYTQLSEVATSEGLPSNLAVCQPPGIELGYGEALQRAELAFTRLFPDKCFLPEQSVTHEDPEDVDLGA